MAQDRIDHFAHMRAEQEPAPGEDKDAPHVSPALIEYLERTFPGPSAMAANDVPGVIMLVTGQAIRVGQLNVINKLKSLVREGS